MKKNKFDAGEPSQLALAGNLSSLLGIGHRALLAVVAAALVGVFFTAFLCPQGMPLWGLLRYTPDQPYSQIFSSMNSSMESRMSGSTPHDMTTMGMRAGDSASMQAIGILMHRLQENPKDLYLQYALGKKFLQAGNYAAAQSFFSRVLETKPSDVNLLSLLGICLAGQNSFFEAATCYEQVVVLQPNNAAAWFNLGILYRDCLNQPEYGQASLEKALSVNDVDPALLNEVRKELGRCPKIGLSSVPEELVAKLLLGNAKILESEFSATSTSSPGKDSHSETCKSGPVGTPAMKSPLVMSSQAIAVGKVVPEKSIVHTVKRLGKSGKH